jgi:hypothetical protein
MLLTNNGVNLQYPSSFSWFREKWIFSKFWILASEYWRFCENLNFTKCPKFIILQYNEFFIIIHNISVSGVVKFPIFGDSFIFPKFWKNESFWKKFRVALVLEVLPMLLTNTGVNLQYPSSFSWFRVIWIFSKFLNFLKGFCENIDLTKMSQIHNSSI